MSSKWQPKTVGDVCSAVFSGGTPTSTNAAYYGGRIPWLRTKEVNYKKITSTENHITQLGLANSSAKLVPVNSVIVAMYGNGDTAGRVAINKIPVTTNQACCNLVVDSDQADYRFVYYYLMSKYQDLVHLKNGGAQQNLNGKTIKGFPISVPDVDVQKSIADMLEALDDSIDVLVSQNTALETLAQTIFRSWFVDFDPVHAKAAGSAPDDMSAELAALFPTEFEASELGLIPKGWTVASFGECLMHTIGGDWGKDVPDEKHIKAVRIIRGTDMPDLLRSDSKTVPARFVQPSKLGQRKLAPYDLVVEVSGGSRDQSTGRALMVTQTMLSELGGVAVPASFCRLFRPRSPELGVILGRRLAWHYKEGNMWGYQVQSTGIANFQTNYFLTNDKMALPPEALQAKFMEIVGPMLQSSCNPVIRALEQLRDHLLPRLISGKLRLEDAEASIAAITSELEAEPA